MFPYSQASQLITVDAFKFFPLGFACFKFIVILDTGPDVLLTVHFQDAKYNLFFGISVCNTRGGAVNGKMRLEPIHA